MWFVLANAKYWRWSYCMRCWQFYRIFIFWRECYLIFMGKNLWNFKFKFSCSSVFFGGKTWTWWNSRIFLQHFEIKAAAGIVKRFVNGMNFCLSSFLLERTFPPCRSFFIEFCVFDEMFLGRKVRSFLAYCYMIGIDVFGVGNQCAFYNVDTAFFIFWIGIVA